MPGVNTVMLTPVTTHILLLLHNDPDALLISLQLEDCVLSCAGEIKYFPISPLVRSRNCTGWECGIINHPETEFLKGQLSIQVKMPYLTRLPPTRQQAMALQELPLFYFHLSI